MEALRNSIREREQAKIMNKLFLLQQSLGRPLNEYLTEEFVNQIPMDSLAWNVIEFCYQNQTNERVSKSVIYEAKLYTEISNNDFVNECLNALTHLHVTIMDYRLNERISKDSIEQLQEQIKIIQSFTQLNINQPNKLSISYTKHKSFKTDIFNHYSLKYKVNLNGQEKKSINSSNDEDYKCFFPILPDSQQLQIEVLGKPRKSDSNTFERLTTIPLELSEVLISFNLKTFSKDQISPAYLAIDFQDETDDAPFKGKTTIELKFELSLPTETRLMVMNQLLEQQNFTKLKLEQQINNTDQSIKSILTCFSDLTYVTGIDIQGPRLENSRACVICNIF